MAKLRLLALVVTFLLASQTRCEEDATEKVDSLEQDGAVLPAVQEQTLRKPDQVATVQYVAPEIASVPVLTNDRQDYLHNNSPYSVVNFQPAASYPSYINENPSEHDYQPYSYSMHLYALSPYPTSGTFYSPQQSSAIGHVTNLAQPALETAIFPSQSGTYFSQFDFRPPQFGTSSSQLGVVAPQYGGALQSQSFQYEASPNQLGEPSSHLRATSSRYGITPAQYEQATSQLENTSNKFGEIASHYELPVSPQIGITSSQNGIDSFPMKVPFQLQNEQTLFGDSTKFATTSSQYATSPQLKTGPSHLRDSSQFGATSTQYAVPTQFPSGQPMYGDFSQFGTTSSQYAAPSYFQNEPYLFGDSSQYGTTSSQYGTPSQYAFKSYQYEAAPSYYGMPSTNFETGSPTFGTTSSQFGIPSSLDGVLSAQTNSGLSLYRNLPSAQFSGPLHIGTTQQLSVDTHFPQYYSAAGSNLNEFFTKNSPYYHATNEVDTGFRYGASSTSHQNFVQPSTNEIATGLSGSLYSFVNTPSFQK